MTVQALSDQGSSDLHTNTPSDHLWLAADGLDLTNSARALSNASQRLAELLSSGWSVPEPDTRDVVSERQYLADRSSKASAEAQAAPNRAPPEQVVSFTESDARTEQSFRTTVTPSEPLEIKALKSTRMGTRLELSMLLVIGGILLLLVAIGLNLTWNS